MRTGLHDRHVDAERPQFVGERLRQRLERPFRRRVDTRERNDHAPDDGTDEHDESGSRRAHRGQERAAQAKRPGDVGCELALERRGRERFGGSEMRGPRVVHQNVDPVAGRFEDVRRGTVDRLLIGHVEFDDGDAEGAEVVRGLGVAAGDVAHRTVNVMAGGREKPGGVVTEAGARAGDDDVEWSGHWDPFRGVKR